MSLPRRWPTRTTAPLLRLTDPDAGMWCRKILGIVEASVNVGDVLDMVGDAVRSTGAESWRITLVDHERPDETHERTHG